MSLANNVQAAQRAGASTLYQNMTEKIVVAGAAVVLNVKDFSILAASTYPSYDLTKYLKTAITILHWQQMKQTNH